MTYLGLILSARHGDTLQAHLQETSTVCKESLLIKERSANDGENVVFGYYTKAIWEPMALIKLCGTVVEHLRRMVI